MFELFPFFFFSEPGSHCVAQAGLPDSGDIIFEMMLFAIHSGSCL
jgi:hypothetical protein